MGPRGDDHGVAAGAIALRSLGALGGLLGEVSDPILVLGRITDEAVRLISAAEGAAAELIDGDGLRCVCATGSLSGMLGLTRSLADSLSGLAVQSGATLRCDDSSTDCRIDKRVASAVHAASVVCVPLRCTDRLVGVLNVAATTPHAFSDRDVATLAALASFIAAVVTAASDVNLATGALVSGPGTSPADPTAPDAAAMSDFIANVLRPGVLADLRAAQRVEKAIADRAFHVVYQPVVDVRDGRVRMAEALSRFTPQPYRTPDLWFADAWRAGFGIQLEMVALHEAVRWIDHLPGGAGLAVNLSPQVIMEADLASFLVPIEAGRLVIELTEHVAVDDYARMRHALLSLRDRGVRLAIDDTGAGFSSFSHILKLAPDIIKLDRELIHGIAEDPMRRSLATAIVRFSQDIGADVVAESVETRDELAALTDLGILYAQGSVLGPPVPVELLPANVAVDGLVPSPNELAVRRRRDRTKRWSRRQGVPRAAS